MRLVKRKLTDTARALFVIRYSCASLFVRSAGASLFVVGFANSAKRGPTAKRTIHEQRSARTYDQCLISCLAISRLDCIGDSFTNNLQQQNNLEGVWLSKAKNSQKPTGAITLAWC